jgi:hypothetical protein
MSVRAADPGPQRKKNSFLVRADTTPPSLRAQNYGEHRHRNVDEVTKTTIAHDADYWLIKRAYPRFLHQAVAVGFGQPLFVAQATHWPAGTLQHGQLPCPPPFAEAGDGPITPTLSAQIANAKTGASLALVNPIFMSANSSAGIGQDAASPTRKLEEGLHPGKRRLSFGVRFQTPVGTPGSRKRRTG